MGDRARTRSLAARSLKDYAEKRGVASALIPAIAGYRALLQGEWTRLKDPVNWAAAQNRSWERPSSLGRLTGDPKRLEEAVAAYRSALEVYTREDMPAGWAGRRTVSGPPFSLGKLAGDPKRLEEGVAAYRSALEVRTREDMPADWAGTQNNLGNALFSLGGLAGDPKRLEEAVAAYRRALEVFTREDMPAGWAMTQNNLAMALKSLGALRKNNTVLAEARAAVLLALEIAPDN